MKKRADGLYRRDVTLTENGKTFRKSFYAKTQKALNDNIMSYRAKIKEGRSFEVVANEWWEGHKTTLEHSTLRCYEAPLKRALEHFKDKPIKSITAQDVNQFIISFSRKKYSQKSVTTQLQVIRQILNYGVLINELESNNALSISIPRGLPKQKRESISEIDISKIKNNVEKPFGLFALFGLYTGCRRGELLALQYKDIDFDSNQISINKSVYHKNNKPFIKIPKTDAGARKVVLIPYLAKYIPKIPDDDYIFSFNRNPLEDKKARTLWNNYCSEVGLSITIHQLRHAYATRLYELGIDEKIAQDLLGHADITTTKNIYTHITEEKRKTVATLLDDF